MGSMAGTLCVAEQAKPADYYTEEHIYQTRPNPAGESFFGIIGTTGLKARVYPGVVLKVVEMMPGSPCEGKFAKDEILTHYLNRIYFGSGAEGIEQAARTYFDKTTPQLSDGECALLVGIIRGPHIFSPRRNLLAAVEQREQTLARLVVMGVIDQARGDRLAAEPVALAAARDFNSQTSYALQAAERELDSLLDALEIEPGGLRVTTTLDRGWQRRLEQELTRAVEELNRGPRWH